MSNRHGVILYGPPASGKDTITAALTSLDERFQQFARLKIGAGRSGGYRMGTAEQLELLEAAGDVVYANSRYGSTYVIDRPGLDVAFASGVPVVHLGQVDGVRALLEGYPANWTTVLLWCSRSITEARSQGRGDADTPARLAAWDATEQDLAAHAEFAWDLTLTTQARPPVESAYRIVQLLDQSTEAATA
ncbi:phosphotransferase-like protein [Streptacidiphilus carbonis]|uniref:phosphotransferase-like protein n=1 Tax=Streptacidiphilus carbonis TaxID=105422 RepID=UPI0005AA20F3|nr:guanylate kinase [Streptacidiphilus carbonis]